MLLGGFSSYFIRSVTEGEIYLEKSKGLRREPPLKYEVFDEKDKHSSEVRPVSLQALREYLHCLWEQYKSAGRRSRSQILDEIERNLRLHRKSAIRLMNCPYPPKSMQGFRGGRKRKYSEESKYHLTRLWKVMGYMASRRMKAALPEWLPDYEHKDCTSEVRKELLRMSESSIERFLKLEKAKLRRKLNTGTRRQLRRFVTEIPIRNFLHIPEEPGHCEIDCVAHCGGILSGPFVWTLNFTDIVTGWTECEAVWGKDGHSIRQALQKIERRLPFKLISLYSDNGSEFLNQDVIEKFARNRTVPIEYYRGRAYQKNDQPYVEQKNFTHVRNIFGYGRIDWQKAVPMMNNIYRKEWRALQNFYMPQQKLTEKYRVLSKIKRKLDRPQTPISRLLKHMDLGAQEELVAEKASRGPIKLRESQRWKTKRLFGYFKNTIDRSEWGKFAL